MKTDMEGTIGFRLETFMFISKARKYYESFNEEDSSSRKPQGVKLPTLNIKAFDGNPLD